MEETSASAAVTMAATREHREQQGFAKHMEETSTAVTMAATR